MTGILTSQGITVRRADSFNIVLQFKTQQGAMDISGAQIKMAVRDDTERLIFEKKAVITDALKGLAAIELTPQETDIEPGDYKTDIQITYAGGQVHTIYPPRVQKVAHFQITPHVTE